MTLPPFYPADPLGLDMNIKVVKRDGIVLFYSKRESSKCEAVNAQQLIKTCGGYGLMTNFQGTPGFPPPRTLYGLRQWHRERDTHAIISWPQGSYPVPVTRRGRTSESSGLYQTGPHVWLPRPIEAACFRC